MTEFGKELIQSLKEARAIARGEMKPARMHVPSDIDVKAIRQKTQLSQQDFAYAFCFTPNQIRDWEQGRSRPLGGVRAYLMIIDRDPGLVRDLLRTAMKKAA
jgi:putative transcriptional regulator